MKTMKKLLVILTAFALISGLAACGGSSGGSGPKKYTAEELYDMYLNDQYPAVVACSIEGAEEGNSYTVSELVYGQVDYFKEYDDYLLGDVYSSIIDCGLDGNPELLLVANYMTPGENNTVFERQYIIKAYDQDLKVLTNDETFYRYQTTVYNSGLISFSGSDSAFEFYVRDEFINAEGERVFLYSESYFSGLADAVIPYYEIPSDSIPGYEELPDYAEADGLALSVFNLSEYGYDEYDEEKYNDYLRDNIFVFYGIEGQNCFPEEPYASMYKDAGINVSDTDTVNDLISQHLIDCGVTDEIAEGTPAELTLLDSETVEWLPKG